MSPHTPLPQVIDLFRKIENNFRATELLRERWYLVTLAALAGGNNPSLCKDLYIYLVSKPEFCTSDQRKYLIRRLRECLIKSICTVGVCKPIEAIISINECERAEDKDYSVTREGWQCDDDNLKRGTDWMQKLYLHNTNETMGYFLDHKDFEWVTKHISYGLYLSDRQVLDDIDTEIVVLVGIMIQNVGREAHWHIRGSRRLGVPKQDVQVVWDSVSTIAGFLGLNMDRIPTVDEVNCDA
jgi:hypothetical protein